MWRFRARFLTIAAFATACAEPPPAHPTPPVSTTSASEGIARIRADARKLAPTLQTDLARRFVGGAEVLPPAKPRVLWRTSDKSRFFTDREVSVEERSKLVRVEADEESFYTTKYGSPLAYSRPIDILAASGLTLGPGSRVLDFGYGTIGHLRLLAALGVDATGVDVDPFLRALYVGEQGPMHGPHGERGSVRLLDGHFPKDPAIVTAVGTGYDLVISKNVLKRGYIHPDRPADPRVLIDLGVPDEVVLRAFAAAVAPGGRMLVYNICPRLSPPDKPFIPWSDGRSPYSREAWEAAGFRVLSFDRDDVDAVRAMGKTLGWFDDPAEPQDPEDLSVLYTLLEKPR